MPAAKPGQTRSRHYIRAVGEPVLTTLGATLIRLALGPIVGSAIPFFTYFGACLLLAWYRGFWPAALSTVLSAFAGAYLFLQHGDNIVSPWGRSDQAVVISFVVTSLTVSFLIDLQRRTLDRIKAAEKAQAEMTKENQRLLAQARQTQEELRRSNEELRRAIKDLEVFAYSVSHDLKEPLRTITIFAELMQRDAAPHFEIKDEATRLASILTAARRMDTLIDDLLLYTRATKFEEGAAPSVDAGRVLAEVLEGLSGQIRDAGATVTVAALPAVAIHRSRLAQLFQNLISNGIKYRGNEAPRIHVSARTGNEWCVFSVADNGLGIDAGYREQIFGLFKRLHGQDYPGNGIGLAICQRLVEQYGGRIWLEKSEPAKGSTFCFSVPPGGEETAGNKPSGSFH
jgi:signal transduction histidine kinase